MLRHTGAMNDALRAITAQAESHVARSGWDQPIRLFALVRTQDLKESDPAVSLVDDLELACVEQDTTGLPTELEAMLSAVSWPDDVIGALIALERFVLPTNSEVEVSNEAQLTTADVASHPGRHDVRMVAAALRDGTTMNAIRARNHDEQNSVAMGSTLIPQLNAAVLATLSS